MSYLDYQPAQARVDTSSGQRYYVCKQCSHINNLEKYEKERKKIKWILVTSRSVKKLFKVLAANLEMTYEETLVYLMKLHEKESHQMYNAISVAGVSNQEESTRK